MPWIGINIAVNWRHNKKCHLVAGCPQKCIVFEGRMKKKEIIVVIMIKINCNVNSNSSSTTTTLVVVIITIKTIIIQNY